MLQFVVIKFGYPLIEVIDMNSMACSMILFVVIGFYFYGFNCLYLDDKLTSGAISIILAMFAFRLHSLIFLVIIYFMIISVLFLGISRLIHIDLTLIGIISLLTAIVINIYGYFNIHDIVFTSYDLEQGYDKRIALLSDMHYPVSLDPSSLENLVNRINEQKPDITIFAGDIVDENTSYDQMVACLTKLSKIDGEKYFVLGNHEKNNYGIKRDYDLDELFRLLAINDIKLLQDEQIMIDDILIYGRDEASLPKFAKEDMVIVVDHEPDDLQIASTNNVDIHLSGHVHGGQLFGVKWLYDSLHLFENSYGKKQIDDMISINSSGVAGWGFPSKSQGKAEVVIIDL